MPSIWKITRSMVLPVTVLGIVPWFIHRGPETLEMTNTSAGIAGTVLFLAGLCMLAWTNILFVVFGKGTLAPWDPTHHLVIAGPYRFVRNPMIAGVLCSLLGEAVFFTSLYLGAWALLFWAINQLWFILWEEPDLEKKFGDSYRSYKSAVPRWIPLTRPIPANI